MTIRTRTFLEKPYSVPHQIATALTFLVLAEKGGIERIALSDTDVFLSLQRQSTYYTCSLLLEKYNDREFLQD